MYTAHHAQIGKLTEIVVEAHVIVSAVFVEEPPPVVAFRVYQFTHTGQLEETVEHVLKANQSNFCIVECVEKSCCL